MMMKSLKIAAAVAVLAAAMMFGSAVNAQTFPFVAAGSSAAFNALAFAGEYSATPVCGLYNWTAPKGFVTGHDNRSGAGASDVAGTVWVEWNTSSGGSTGPVTTVCAYLNIDSIVGSRLYFANPQGSLSFVGGCPNNSGIAYPPNSPNQVLLLPADVSLPTTVCNALNGQTVNAVPSDIRPEDAQFGTQRACGPFISATNPATLGYGGTGNTCSPGVAIASAFSTSTAQPIAFTISGKDPITANTIPAWKSLDVGAQIALIVYNTQDTGDSGAGLGNAVFTNDGNVDRWVLAKVLDGTLGRTRDLIPEGEGLPSIPLDVVVREPLSGTMNTVEFSVTRDKEIDSSQELGINPGGAAPTGWTGTTNPLDITKTSAHGSTRKLRAIGTGEMVKAIAGTVTPISGGTYKNQVGYVFFSYGNVSPLTNGSSTSIGKYFDVDGVDPFYADYASNPDGLGVLPVCTVGSGTSSCNGAITFPNIANGSYPLWNVLRVVTTPSLAAVGGSVNKLVVAAQNYATSFVPDFVPYGNLQVFRAHRAVTLYVENYNCGSGSGCTKSYTPEDGFTTAAEGGSDVGGAVFTVEAELDYQADNSNKQLVTFQQ